MPLPASAASISDIAVIGVFIEGDDFPRDRTRRIPANLLPEDEFVLTMDASEVTDFAVDCALAFEADEAIIAAYAWSDTDEMVVTRCRFADRGIYANVSGGVDGASCVLSIHAQTNKARAYQWKLTIDITGTATAPDPAPADTSYPKNAYLEDVLGVILEPAYADVNDDPLSVAL